MATFVCRNCVGDSYLRGLIDNQGMQGDCEYCDADELVVELDWLADQVKTTLESHFVHTSPDAPDWPMEWLKEELWERSGEQIESVIAEMLGVSVEPVATDVRRNLAERFGDYELVQMGVEESFAEEAHYKRRNPGHDDFLEAWSELETTIRTESRYFNRRAEEVLDFIFEDVESICSRFGVTAIAMGSSHSPFNSVFRGRVAKDESTLRKILASPETELGPPPKGMSSVGRMNAPGISVFYGANDPKTVLAEVRPPVGSQVVVAKFKFAEELRFLDISGFEKAVCDASDFDPKTLRRLKQIGFLRHLSGLLTRPVLPGEETSEYLITQVVAEYLAQRFDGLIFPSVQAETGFNVALFGDAAAVRTQQQLPEGTDIRVDCYRTAEEGPEPDYCISEVLPRGAKLTGESEHNFDDALRLERGTVRVHYIHAVEYKSSEQSARWERYEASDCSVF